MAISALERSTEMINNCFTPTAISQQNYRIQFKNVAADSFYDYICVSIKHVKIEFTCKVAAAFASHLSIFQNILSKKSSTTNVAIKHSKRDLVDVDHL